MKFIRDIVKLLKSSKKDQDEIVCWNISIPDDAINELQEIHYDVESYEKCMIVSSNEEERDNWREKLVASKLIFNRKLFEYSKIYGVTCEEYMELNNPPPPVINYHTKKMFLKIEERYPK